MALEIGAQYKGLRCFQIVTHGINYTLLLHSSECMRHTIHAWNTWHLWDTYYRRRIWDTYSPQVFGYFLLNFPSILQSDYMFFKVVHPNLSMPIMPPEKHFNTFFRHRRRWPWLWLQLATANLGTNNWEGHGNTTGVLTLHYNSGHFGTVGPT